jgi:hypothetical protein
MAGLAGSPGRRFADEVLGTAASETTAPALAPSTAAS